MDTYASQRYFQAAKDFFGVPDVLNRFLKIKNVSSSDAIYYVIISCNYIPFSVTDSFGLGKWLLVKTSPVDENSDLVEQ